MASVSYRLLGPLLVLAAAASGCATAGENTENPGDPDGAPAEDGQPADAGPDPDAAPPVDAAPPIDASPPQPQPITITHSTSAAITSGNSVSCNLNDLHANNSYYRTFALSTLGISSAFTVQSVDVGVETATGAGGLQPATLNLYTLNGAFTLANLTLIGTVGVTVTDRTLSLMNVPIQTVVPAGATLVVELFTPDGQTAGHTFFIGSNTAAETAPSFIRALDCGITEPTSTAGIGFPDMHIVMRVNGTHIP